MTISSLTRIARDNPPLFALILRWYLYPIDNVHPRQRERVLGGKEVAAEMERLCEKSHRYAYFLGRFMLRRCGVGADSLESFSLSSKRLLLLEGGLLERILFTAGIVVYAQGIAREIRRERVRRIKEGIGLEGYRFALKRVPFFFPQVEKVSKPLPPKLDEFPMRCSEEGMAIFKGAVGTITEGSRIRFLMKLPPSMAIFWDDAPPCTLSPEDAFALMRRLVKLEGGERWMGFLS